MTRAQAMALAQKTWGKTGSIGDNSRRLGKSSPAARAAASEEYRSHIEAKPRIDELSEWPPMTPIGEYRAALATYRAAYAKWKQRDSAIEWRCDYRAFQVGQAEAGFLGAMFRVMGKGDTWEEAFGAAGVPVPRMRYCGSKSSHDAHAWQQIGRPEGPRFDCPGKGGARLAGPALVVDDESDRAEAGGQ